MCRDLLYNGNVCCLGCLCSALLSLAFVILHTFSMVVSFEGIRHQKKFYTFLTPALHLIAALLVRNLLHGGLTFCRLFLTSGKALTSSPPPTQTLGNFASNGCLVVIPLTLAISLIPVAVVTRLCWQRAARGPHLYAGRIQIESSRATNALGDVQAPGLQREEAEARGQRR